MEKEPRVKLYRKDESGRLRYFTVAVSELNLYKKED